MACTGAPNHGAYGAAKAGVMALVRTMAQEWGPHGIRVNGRCDMIATPRIVAVYDEQHVDYDETARRDGAPLGRFGVPEEIVGPLVFLVSDLAGFMTGQTLVVDGGQRARVPPRAEHPDDQVGRHAGARGRSLTPNELMSTPAFTCSTWPGR